MPLKGGAVRLTLASLLKRGLVEEIPAEPGQEVWRTTDEGTTLALRATPAAYEALGLAMPTSAEPATRAPRAGTKQALLIAMLKRPEGATIDEVIAATGWQAHTVRGAIAGALKKKLGLIVTSEKVDERGRVYRISALPVWRATHRSCPI